VGPPGDILGGFSFCGAADLCGPADLATADFVRIDAPQSSQSLPGLTRQSIPVRKMLLCE
jgi:hypothetical protein